MITIIYAVRSRTLLNGELTLEKLEELGFNTALEIDIKDDPKFPGRKNLIQERNDLDAYACVEENCEFYNQVSIIERTSFRNFYRVNHILCEGCKCMPSVVETVHLNGDYIVNKGSFK